MIKEIQLDGFKLSYTSEGEGSDVLLLHGFPSNMFFWNNIKNDLLNNYRVTVVNKEVIHYHRLKMQKIPTLILNSYPKILNT